MTGAAEPLPPYLAASLLLLRAHRLGDPGDPLARVPPRDFIALRDRKLVVSRLGAGGRREWYFTEAGKTLVAAMVAEALAVPARGIAA